VIHDRKNAPLAHSRVDALVVDALGGQMPELFAKQALDPGPAGVEVGIVDLDHHLVLPDLVEELERDRILDGSEPEVAEQQLDRLGIPRLPHVGDLQAAVLTLEALRGAVFGTLLLGIAMTDARKYIIPDEFTWGGLVIGLLFSLAGGLEGLGAAALGAAVGFGILWLVGTVGTWVFKEDAMGGGDIKMMAMVGAFLGWQGVLLTIFLGAFAGTLIFVPLMLMGQKKLVPFGIFLAIGAAICYEAGPALIDWYGRYLAGA